MDAFIISSNIRFSTHDDGLHAWPLRKEILANIYLRYSPLLIGTQEGRKPQLDELKSLLPGYQISDQHRNWMAERMYPCIFFNEKHLKLTNSGDFWLSETPDIDGSSSFESMFPRLCTWVCLEFSGTEFYVFNTHLDHVKSSTRAGQIQVVCDQIEKINKNKSPVILMGDFNDCPLSETRNIIIKQVSTLKDDWSLPEEASHHPFTGENAEGQRIDWILHNFDQRAEIFLDKSSVDGIWPSDHFPLIAKFKF